MAIPVFAPPHPQAVFRVLKTAFRAWMASGSAAGADLPAIAGQPAANPISVTGTVYASQGVPLPATVSVSLVQGGPLLGTQTANVNQVTGAFTATIPGGAGAAGAANVRVTAVTPPFTANGNSFTLT